MRNAKTKHVRVLGLTCFQNHLSKVWMDVIYAFKPTGCYCLFLLHTVLATKFNTTSKTQITYICCNTDIDILVGGHVGIQQF